MKHLVRFLKFLGQRKVLMGMGAALVLALVHLAVESYYERPVTFERPQDLNRQDCRVGVLTGYASETIGRRVFPRAQIVGFDDFEEAFMAVLAGTIEGFVYSDHVLNVGLRAYPNRFKILDESLSDAPSIVLLSPQRGDLLAEMNKFIANTRALGIYDDMVARWCQSDEYVPMPEIPEADGSNGVIRIGTSGEEEPSSFYDDDGNLTGFDIEFARRFAQMVGMKPEIVCRPDGTILQELLDGKLDMVIDNYTIGEAIPGVRASDSYFDSEMKVLVRSGDEATMMLGSTRLGYSRRIIKDPRLSLLLSGFVTTILLCLFGGALGLIFARGLREIEHCLTRGGRAKLSMCARAIRLVPPPIVIMILSCLGFGATQCWLAIVIAVALWFACNVEPVLFEHPRLLEVVLSERLVDLIQWTSLAGALSVCDLTMAIDLVCGRSPVAVTPLVSVAAAYWCAGRLVQHAGRKYVGRIFS